MIFCKSYKFMKNIEETSVPSGGGLPVSAIIIAAFVFTSLVLGLGYTALRLKLVKKV